MDLGTIQKLVYQNKIDKGFILKPEYRRMGIAFRTLDLLVAEAKKKGVSAISLEATEMGKPLYEKYGFIKMNDEMELPNHGI